MDINKIKIKGQILRLIREFFDSRGFVEVDTPTLVRSPDPSLYHEVFETKSVTGESLYLIPSPEFFLKRLISEGMRNVYQITKCYRDSKESDPLHRREFSMIEWYRDGGIYTDLMTDCTDLTKYVTKELYTYHAGRQGFRIPTSPSFDGRGKCGMTNGDNDFKIPATPWLRISCKEAFEKYAHVNLDNFTGINHARKICVQRGYNTVGANWEQLYHQVFLNEVEPELLKFPAFFLYDYPAQLAELSQVKKDDPKYAERFEWYLNGLEIGNGYSELTDYQEQEIRLKDSIEERKKRGMKVFPYDQGLVDALRKGLPKTAGIAVGVDRFVMAVTGDKDIGEISPYNL